MSPPPVEARRPGPEEADARGRPLPVLVLALGNPDRGDDGAALAAAERLRDAWRPENRAAEDRARGESPAGPPPEIVAAGRPGVGLLDLLRGNGPVLLMDVTCSGEPAGTVRHVPLQDLTSGLLPDLRASSHGFGAGEAVALARALGRRLPPGYFLGIEGSSYGLGEGISGTVQERLGILVDRARALIGEMAR
jgi:hydrogenase maturation protease